MSAMPVRPTIYETEQQARVQGYHFAVLLLLPRWEQFGYVRWATEEAAIEAGRASVAAGNARAFEVYRNANSGAGVLVYPAAREEVA